MRRVLSKISGVLAGVRDEGSKDVQEEQAVTVTEVANGDPACVGAVELARAAAVEVAGPAVGEHLGVEVDDALVVTHSFATTEKAYTGWRWAVTVARADGDDGVTVDEVVLLPGGGALVSPPWVPYADRVQPGDLSPGDLLPPAPGDPRLVPAYADPDAELAQEVHWELGLGRVRVLSLDGRADAAERWYEGDRGPLAPIAKAAPARCFDCGFLVHMAGSMRQVFGVCANAMAPDDGRVVSFDHGCGAHSEVLPEPTATAGMAVEHDEIEIEIHDGAAVHPHGTVEDDDPAEPLGHS